MKIGSTTLLAVLLTAACDPNEVDAPTSASDFCADLAEAWVTRYAACAGVTLGADVLAEASSPSAIPLCEQAQKAVANGRTTMDAGSAQQCLAGFSSADCRLIREASTLDASDACRATFRGTVAPGGTCTFDFDCAGGYCATQNAECSGSCVAWLGVGGDCSDGARCGAGLYCDASSHCAAVLAPSGDGGPCDSGQKCQAGLHCDAGICRPLQTSGACDDLDVCASEYTCVVAQGDTSPTCVRYLELGADCTSAPDACFLGACDATGHCVDMPAATQSCVAGTRLLPCAQAWCNGTVCVALTPVGESCTQDVECGYLASCEPATSGSGTVCTARICAEP